MTTENLIFNSVYTKRKDPTHENKHHSYTKKIAELQAHNSKSSKKLVLIILIVTAKV